MYTHRQNLSEPEIQELRRECGHFLKYLRECAGHSQRSFAAAVNQKRHLFVSQVERGVARVPPDQLRVWAQAYGIKPSSFTRMILRYYDAESFAILFEHDPEIFSGEAFPELKTFLAMRAADTAETPPIHRVPTDC
ncbi:helix-turn-helix domain-containing protein [Methylobacterium nigriterrae]|uniref:helix-turn-helix domain-containing protein n=1 Tax=Methylobacterium nigriterrae TaxID=3127512 RepID=UPI003013B6B3